MESVFSKMHETLKRNFKRRAGGTRYFSNLHRGEGAELRADMNSTDLARQRSAVKRVIASMTLGRDVSNLFIEVVKLGQTNNLELKKLVYLYVLNTAKLQPEKALMAINTFLQDTRHTNPIVRALAVRTMLCVRVSSVMEYALEPLRRATHDSNPYVRKAAAIGIGKVFHQNMKYFYDHGLFDDLMKLLSDNDAMVVANTAAVLAEVRDFGTEKLTLQFKCHTIALRRLVGANEWGKIYLLELLTMNLPSDPAAPKLLAESVLPLLHHENPAVVMGAIKCLVTCASRSEANMIEVFSTRINAALLNLLQEEPETQFVVCRNIHSLIVVFPTLMRSNLDALYVHFNDPPYLKLEKVRLLSKLVTPETSAAVLDELVEYTKDVDFLFVQKVIEAIALTAINTNMVADIGAALRRVLSYKPNAFAEVLMAIRDILGRCAEVPDVQARLTDIVEEFSPDMILEEEPKCALLWLVASGFQGFTVEARREVFRYYVETLISQEPSVQLATLCTAITLFNSPNPEVDQATVRQVLDSLATRATSPDVRDRSISMHRLLSKGNRDLMKAIAESTRESIHAQQTFNDAMTMGDLKRSINTAAAVFFRPFYTFLPPYGIGDLDDVTTNNGSAMRDVSSEDDSPESATAGGGSENVSAASPAAYADPLDDLFGSSSPATPDAGQQAAAQSAPVGFNTATVGGMSNAMDDLFGA